MAHVLNCLAPVDFADIFFHHFGDWFNVLLKDDGLMTTFQHLLKQRPDSSSSHWPVATNMLRYVLENEMDALEDLGAKRGKVVMQLCRVIFGKLMDPVNEVRSSFPFPAETVPYVGHCNLETIQCVYR